METRKNWISTEKKLQKQKKNNVCSKRADRLVGSFFVQNRKICPSDLFQNALPAKVIRILFFKNGKREEMIFTLSQKKQKSFKALL